VKEVKPLENTSFTKLLGNELFTASLLNGELYHNFAILSRDP
jgi:hypothetical protein